MLPGGRGDQKARVRADLHPAPAGYRGSVRACEQADNKEPNMKLERFKRYDVATDEQAEAAFTVVACIVAAILLIGICLVVRWLL